MDVDARHRLLDRPDDREVVVAVERRMDAALEADLDGTALPGLLDAADDLVERHEIRRPRRFSASLPFENAQKPHLK